MKQLMFNLFYCKVPVSEIKAMDFFEMLFWNECHELEQKTWENLQQEKNAR